MSSLERGALFRVSFTLRGSTVVCGVTLFLVLPPKAAYRDNTLGLPMFCPQENLPLITTSHLRQYVTSHFTPERMTVAGCGVDHNQLVELAEEYFVDPRRSWEVEELPVDGSLAQYTGGEKTVSRVEEGVGWVGRAALG